MKQQVIEMARKFFVGEFQQALDMVYCTARIGLLVGLLQQVDGCTPCRWQLEEREALQSSVMHFALGHWVKVSAQSQQWGLMGSSNLHNLVAATV